MLQYILGPRLYRIFTLEASGCRKLKENYDVNRFEWLGESFLYTVSCALSLTYYCSPFLAYYVYQKDFTADHLSFYLKFSLSVCIGIAASYLIRGYGRSCNPEYGKFLEVLKLTKADKKYSVALQNYDFDFKAWPVDFRWDESIVKSTVADPSPLSDYEESKSFLGQLLSVPKNLLDYCLGHGIARPMAFPGSVKLLQMAMGQMISQGRLSLLEKKGRRGKMLCENGNEIDTMFVDRRNDPTGASEGETLVIACEGNAAFYEVGIVETARKAGYSVLGWNHPGFMGSTGQPFPEQERQAVDVVMQYAVTKLGFEQENIVLFAWSIGGYAASYAAMMYPNVKALVLDATFDGIIQLGAARMPSFAVNTVKRVIRRYMFLDVTRQAVKYSGPIQLIRRQREEIITTRSQVPATNRGNYLLWKLLLFRYPHIITEKSTETLWQYLAAVDADSQDRVIAKYGGINEDSCERKLTLKAKPTFPLNDLGKNWSEEEKIEVTLFLATKYMVHFDATHCIALPASYFQMPWKHRTRK